MKKIFVKMAGLLFALVLLAAFSEKAIAEEQIQENDIVYSLENMYLYSDSNLEAQRVEYVLRGDALRVTGISENGEWLNVDFGWCRIETVSKEDVAFIPGYEGEADPLMFESLINASNYMERFPATMLSKMHLLNLNDFIPVFSDGEFVEYGYSADGINSVEALREIFENFFTADYIESFNVMERFSNDEMGIKYSEGKPYFNYNYGIGWPYWGVINVEQLAEGEWEAQAYAPEYGSDYRMIYNIVLEDGKYKINDECSFSAGFRFRTDNGGAIITGYDGTDLILSIPKELAGYKVTGIGARAFFDCDRLKKVVMSDSVTFLGDGAFQHCYNLESINLSKNITRIGYDVFSYCSMLKELVIPASVNSMGGMNFPNCGVKEIRFEGSAPAIEEGNENYVFYGLTATAYYPAGDSSWTKEAMAEFGGDIIWVAYSDKPENVIRVEKLSDGKWYYTVNGKKDLKFTGFADNANGRWRIENGVVNFNYTNVIKDENQWRYYSGGKWQTGTTSVVKRTDNNTWWYVRKGVVDFSVTSIVRRVDNNTWWYVKGGQVQFGFNGFADNENGRYRVEKGTINYKYTNIVKDENQWRYYSNGKWQTGTTSVVKRTDNNTWWYVRKGVVDFSVTSVVPRTDNNTWWYVKGGQVQFGVTNVVKRVEDNTWWYVKGGQAQTSLTSVVKRTDNNTWWYVKGGQVQFGVTSVVKRADNNTWWYVKGGQVQFGVTSVIQRTDNNTWWYVKGGQVQFGVTNVVKRVEDNTWWYVKGGQSQTSLTSVVKRTDNNTWWYVENGQVRFDYNGSYQTYLGKKIYTWTIQGGKITNGDPDSCYESFPYYEVEPEIYRFGDYYIKYEYSSGGKIYISTGSSGKYKLLPFSEFVTNGKTAYYLKNDNVYQYDLGTGSESKIVSFKNILKGYDNDIWDPTRAKVIYAYGQYVFVEIDYDLSFSDVYSYNTKTGVIKKTKDVSIIETQGEYLATRTWNPTDVSFTDLTLYKIQSDGSLKKIKQLTSASYRETYINGRLYYIDAIDAYNKYYKYDIYYYGPMINIVIYSCNFDGSSIREEASFATSKPSGWADIGNITGKNCIINNNVYVEDGRFIESLGDGIYSYDYSTKTFNFISSR